MDDAGIYAHESTYLGRYVQIGYASGRLLTVEFPTEPDAEAITDHPLLARIDAYLEGVEDDFADVQVALTLPTEQRRVLEVVRDIPYGEQLNVDGIARMTPGLSAADEDDLTVVRTALDANPVPIVIPDHRVRDGPSAADPDVEQKLRALEGL